VNYDIEQTSSTEGSTTIT